METMYFKVSDAKAALDLKKYSLEDINNLLSGKELENTIADKSDAPKLDSKLIFNLISYKKFIYYYH